MTRRTTGRPGGFTLIEVTAAMLLFFLLVTFALWAMSDSYDQALASERARQLRMLGELKLGELAVFERHFDDNLGPDEFTDLPDGLREQFERWTWQIDVRDVTVFGQQKDENAPLLFDTGETATSADATTGDESATPAKKGETQLLREVVLKVTAPGDDGGEGDSIEIVTYLPQVPAKAAATGAGAGGGK